MENQGKQRLPVRDFIFIDEAGEPGIASNYYVLGLIHLTDVSLEKINIHLGALRYFGKIRKELKSTKMSQEEKERIPEIILSVAGETFIAASAIYVDKNQYAGKYLGKNSSLFDTVKFRNNITRKLLEFHFSHILQQSREIELIFDRMYPNEGRERQLQKYLRTKELLPLPNFNFIIQADSRYVELLQVADWVAGVVKEKYFTHSERDYEEFLDFIHIQQIKK
jgi:hypothetical protein